MFFLIIAARGLTRKPLLERFDGGERAEGRGETDTPRNAGPCGKAVEFADNL